MNFIRVRLKTAISEFFSSKKAAAMVAGVLILIGQKYGLPIDAETAEKIAQLLMAYVIGQGFADIGKSAPK